MARLNLANEHHGTLWVCQTATFDEGEEREWDSFATHAAFSTHAEAIMWASRLAHDYASVLSLFVAVAWFPSRVALPLHALYASVGCHASRASNN